MLVDRRIDDGVHAVDCPQAGKDRCFFVLSMSADMSLGLRRGGFSKECDYADLLSAIPARRAGSRGRIGMTQRSA